MKRLKESESLIQKNEQTIQELSILKDSLLQDIRTYKDNQEQLAQTNERLENLSRIKARLEEELETEKNKCITLSKWKKEREDLLKHAIVSQISLPYRLATDRRGMEHAFRFRR